MTILEHSIVINTTTEAIDEVVLDATRLPEWYVGIQETRPDAVYPQVGGQVEAVYKAAGMNFKIKMTCLEIERGQKQTLKMEGMISGTNRWTYTPAEDGTRITGTFEYELPGGSIGQAINKLIVERMNAENLEKSLQNLKTLV